LLSFKKILIVANSGRMLAQLAKKNGFTPLVIDCFADFDTQGYARQVVKIKSLALSEVKKALTLLSKQHDFTHVIYGSGLECFPSSIGYLEQRLIVLGNSFQVFSKVQNKRQFFLTLEQNKISYPESSFHQPDDCTGWLLKPVAGEGGIGIKKYLQGTVSDGECYWQKQNHGMPKSVLFVANSKDFKIIGFHKQFITQIADCEFVFSGLITQLVVDEMLEQTLNNIVGTLVNEFSLKGINSVDFMENNGEYSILEVNPRPSASMNLYRSTLYLMHIKSCLTTDELGDVQPLKSFQGYKIIFAIETLSIDEQINWPIWVNDIPVAGSIIHTGEPICSIIAGGRNEQQVEGLLVSRQQQILNHLR